MSRLNTRSDTIFESYARDAGLRTEHILLNPEITDRFRDTDVNPAGENRTEAAGIVARLIARVKIHPRGTDGPEAEVEASIRIV